MTYDLIVLGGGPAGYNAAERAAEAGMNTLLYEGKALGGVCLNEGCVPTKTLLYSAKIYDYAKHGASYGISFEGASIDQAAVLRRKGKVIKTLVAGIGMTLKKKGVTVISEFGTIAGRADEGFAVSSPSGTNYGKKLLICTGSSALVPPITGLREAVEAGFAMTNREILELDAIPERLVVIGGGVIGLEMASYFNSAGSNVTVIEMLDHIGGPTDGEISKILLNNYKKKGINFILGAKVTEVGKSSVAYETDGKTQVSSADKVLVSIGRRAVTKDIGLESIGVLTERGAVVTDEFCKTNVPGVYAAGDVNGKVMLAHTAYREGEVAVANMLGGRERVNYNSIPSVIYTNPEVASVGETSESAEKKGLDVVTTTVSMRYSGRYLAENEGGDGIVKLITDKAHGTLLGVSMIGNYASEIIYGAAVMVDKHMTVRDIKNMVFPHPTVCEVIREAAYAVGE